MSSDWSNASNDGLSLVRSFSHWSPVFHPAYLKGLLVDWSGLVANTDCVRYISVFNESKIYPKISHRNVVIIVSRLVKGRLSDSMKTVRVPVPGGADNITLILDCEDKLPYRVQVNTLLRKSD